MGRIIVTASNFVNKARGAVLSIDKNLDLSIKL
jgi:hypothetical protein